MTTGFIVLGTFGALIAVYLGLQGWEIWQDLRPNRMRAVFVDAKRQVTAVRVTIGGSGKDFVHGDKKYNIVDSAVYRVGRFRVPTCYYRADRREPISLWDLRAESDITAADFKEATEAHVARDIINAFDTPLLSPTMSLMLIGLAIAAVLFFVYSKLNGRLDEIATAVGVVSNGG